MKDLRKESRRKSDMMARKVLLDTITRHKDEYRTAYPKTADSDLTLVGAYCAGLSAAHVALDHHCAESTVHRALNRVREFVQLQEHHNRWQSLLDHVMENAPNFGDCDAQSLLELFYEAYSDWNQIDDDTTRERIRILNERLKALTIPEADSVLDIVYSVCRCHQRTGFCEGIKLGVCLAEELKS